jgi:hypothetical protein
VPSDASSCGTFEGCILHEHVAKQGGCRSGGYKNEGWRSMWPTGSLPPMHCPSTTSTAPLYAYAVLVLRRESTSRQVPEDGEETTVSYLNMYFTVLHVRDY